MSQQIDVNRLKECADTHSISFESIPAKPVTISLSSVTDDREINEAIRRFHNHGFAILDCSQEKESNEQSILKLGKIFNLGEVFVPPLYTKGQYKTNNISTIKAQEESKHHPSFKCNDKVELHCDGTLQPIGMIVTSILLCKSPAAQGGDNILFNATLAFKELLSKDPQAAIALSTHGSLVRQANLNHCTDKNIGPAFTIKDERIICAYSTTKTDSFIAAEGIDADDLKRGVDFMYQMSLENSPYFYKFCLQEGQAIMFANTRMAHGRTSFYNSKKRMRCLYRGIFLTQPHRE